MGTGSHWEQIHLEGLANQKQNPKRTTQTSLADYIEIIE